MAIGNAPSDNYQRKVLFLKGRANGEDIEGRGHLTFAL